MTETIYSSIGTTQILNDQRGTLTGLLRKPAPAKVGQFVTEGAFVRLDGPVDAEGRYIAPGPMLYLELGDEIETAGGVHYEVKRWRAIDRDEFDRINGLDTLRADLGWS